MRRFRFSFPDSYEDPHYIDAETEEQALATFGEHWSGYISSARAAERNEDIPPVDEAVMYEVGQKQHEFGPRPSCCESINAVRDYDFYKGPLVQLRVFRGSYEEAPDPRWKARDVGIEIFYCSFCGTKLPEVERVEDPPQPIWDGDDYRCGTCGERNHACECNPPEAAYGVKR